MSARLLPGSNIEFPRSWQLTVERVVYASPETGRSLYKVHNGHDGLSYALKLVPADSPQEVEAVRREGVALNRQNDHPDRLPRFRGCILKEQFAYMLLDWLEGVPLDQLTRGQPVSSNAEVGPRLELAIEACEAVALLHRNRFVHRDVKPANLLARDPRRASRGVALVDLGLSTQKRRIEEGTRGYHAPEQFGMRNQNLTAATDVFALAQVTWYVLTGGVRDLIQAEGVSDWQSLGPSLGELLPGITFPERLESVLRKAVDFRPEQRYPHAGAFARELRDASRARSRSR